MRFTRHIEVQGLVFLVLVPAIGINASTLVVSFHFIPSLDYAMKKYKFYPELHRRLLHNVFALIGAALLVTAAGYGHLVALAAANFLLHVFMDASGNGVEFFYPVSRYRLRVY